MRKAEQLQTYAKALVTRKPAKELCRFVIFAKGRSGSTLLADLLNCLPGVFCDDEILSRPVLAPRLWVEAHRRQHPASHYGFKVKVYQLTDAQHLEEPGRLLRLLDSSGWKVIYLRRTDLVRHVLSSMVLARDSREKTHYVGDQSPVRTPLRVDPAILLEGVRARAALDEQERRALTGVNHASLTYEDDLMESRNHQPTLDRLASYLGLATAPATTTRKRINTGPLRDLVENYDDLASALAGTPWELVAER